MEAFLRDPARLAEAEAWLAKGDGSPEQRKCLQIFVRTFKCYQMSDAEAVALRDQCTAVEDSLSAARNHMRLGYEAPGGGGFVERSSVQLRTALRTDDDEAVRKAAWEGLRSIGPFVLDNGLCEMVRLRNEMARRLGYKDFCVCPRACPLRDVAVPPPPPPTTPGPPQRGCEASVTALCGPPVGVSSCCNTPPPNRQSLRPLGRAKRKNHRERERGPQSEWFETNRRCGRVVPAS